MSNVQIACTFFMQVAILLAACRITAMLLKPLGQPPVVAEMIAGVLLGPSLFGLYFPETSALIFPKASMPTVYAVAQFALVLYMFLVGLEFQIQVVRDRAKAAISISIAGMIVPFALGVGLASLLIGRGDFFGMGVSANQSAVFLGAAMCITAFPMLARIIQEGGLSGTSVGALALAAGSFDDAAAWCILAVMLASFESNPTIAAMAIGGGVAYVLVVVFALRPILKRLATNVENRCELAQWHLATIMLLLLAAAWFTEHTGLHAVFGAFVLGAATPRGLLSRSLISTLSPITSVALLPLFFVYSGLNTRLSLVNGPELWLITGAVLAVACAGKFIACAAAAKLNGEPTRDSFAIGALMNARGLMELIILNIGLQRGIITPTLFSIMVVMAIATTLMATPAFKFILKGDPRFDHPKVA